MLRFAFPIIRLAPPQAGDELAVGGIVRRRNQVGIDRKLLIRRIQQRAETAGDAIPQGLECAGGLLDRRAHGGEGPQHPAAGDLHDTRLKQHAITGTVETARDDEAGAVPPRQDALVRPAAGIARLVSVDRLEVGHVDERRLHETPHDPVGGHAAEVVEIRSPGMVREHRDGDAPGVEAR